MSKRTYKVNELIKEEVSQILFREVNFGRGIITVTAVETTPDLRHAVVWLSVFGLEIELLEKTLKEKHKSMQKSLNERVHLKYVPKVEFRFDQSGEYIENISRVFQKIKRDESNK